MNNKVVICIGGNLEPRISNVAAARDWLLTVLKDPHVSDIYETPEIHGIGRPYMNMVISGTTDLDIDSLNMMCKDFEIKSGRDAEARSRGDVPVDIDIVRCNDRILRPEDYRQQFFRIGAKSLGLKL